MVELCEEGSSGQSHIRRPRKFQITKTRIKSEGDKTKNEASLQPLRLSEKGYKSRTGQAGGEGKCKTPPVRKNQKLIALIEAAGVERGGDAQVETGTTTEISEAEKTARLTVSERKQTKDSGNDKAADNKDVQLPGR